MRGDKMKLITRNHYLNKLIDVKILQILRLLLASEDLENLN